MSANRLRRLEKAIDQSRRRFCETGAALRKIRDERLYKVSLFDSFESYVGHRREMGKSQAYRLIEASRVVENLSLIGNALPANEDQARVLARLQPAEQKRVWRECLESGTEQTASNIKRFVRAPGKKAEGPREDLTGVIGDECKKSALQLMEQIDLAKNDGWLTASSQAALLWNRSMKDKILSKRQRR